MNLDEKIKKYGLEYFGRYYSCYRATVSENEDPEHLGRLKLKIPEVHKSVLDYWAWPKGMFAGKNKGFFAIPDIGDAIWVEFEKGDPNFPVWNYGWWGENQLDKAADKPSKYLFQTGKGQRLLFNDDEGSITVTNKAGKVFFISSDGIYLGKEDINLGKLLDDLFELFEGTKVSTQLGPQPFINVLQYTQLREKFSQLLLNSYASQ